MLARERQSEIVKMITGKGAVTTTELVSIFDVSVETIRRDLLELEKQGILQRVHGGAIKVGEMTPIVDLTRRKELDKDSKIELCETAAMLVEDGDIICIDCGSTAIYFAEALKRRLSKLTIVTHSLDVFNIMVEKAGFEVILCAGFFMKEEKAFYGHFVQEALKKIHVQKAFLFPSAISLQGGVGDYIEELQQVQRQMMQCSDKVYFLANSEKFEKHALLKLCDMSDAYVYVSDEKLNESYKKLYQEAGLNVIWK